MKVKFGWKQRTYGLLLPVEFYIEQKKLKIGVIQEVMDIHVVTYNKCKKKL